MVDHLEHLRADAEAVVAVVRRADLTEPVAGCPGWTLRDLVLHLGGVHRWANRIVQTGRPSGDDEQPQVDDLAGWFAEGAEQLIETLRAADPAAGCWSFTSDKTAGFWVRRQALETVVHRWDAERAIGEPGPVDPALAADGVAEVVDLMLPRQVKLERIPPLAVAMELVATDSGQRWTLGPGSPVAVVEAPAELLLLLLWHRVDPGDPRLTVSGDREAAVSVLREALAP